MLVAEGSFKCSYTERHKSYVKPMVRYATRFGHPYVIVAAEMAFEKNTHVWCMPREACFALVVYGREQMVARARSVVETNGNC